MDTRIQFRMYKKTKCFAQQMIESQDNTFSDACRNLTIQLSTQQRKATPNGTWLTKQLNLAFEKLNSGEAVYFKHEEAKSSMAERKAKIRKMGSIC